MIAQLGPSIDQTINTRQIMQSHQETQQELWYLTGSQHLYGPEALKQVARNSEQLVASINASRSEERRVG